MKDRYRTVLALFAHPDDETLAAGATISRLTREGVGVHVGLTSTGVRSRRRVLDEAAMAEELTVLRKDTERALDILGVAAGDIHFGGFPDNENDSRTLLELIHWCEGVVEEVRPDLILTHHRFDTNIDHRYCHDAVITATRPSTDLHVPVWCGEIPSSTGYLRPVQWEPNLWVAVEEADVARKVAAMEAYSGEARPDPHPRSREVLAALAKVRGSEGGHWFAEAFMVQRAFE